MPELTDLLWQLKKVLFLIKNFLGTEYQINISLVLSKTRDEFLTKT